MKNSGRIIFIVICLCLLLSSFVPKAYAASAMKASDACVDFIKKVEGFSAKPYYDYSQHTVGYGTKCPSDKYFEYLANGIPKSEAEVLLREAIAEVEDAINQKLIDKYNLTFNQHQFDALVSFSFNIGTGWMTYDSSLRSAILKNASAEEFVYAFSLYCTAGGKYSSGLVTRRLCEANIYLNGVYSQKISDEHGYVFYEANGGTLTYRVQGYICNSNSAPATSAERSGDVFLGWYTNVTGGTQVRGQTLFAHWQSSENNQDQLSTVVKVTGDVVNIRKGPGTNYGIAGQVRRNEILTVSHVTELTSMKWGKVQDGWICLDYTNYDHLINGTDDSSTNNTESSEPSTESVPNENASSSTQSSITGIVRVNDALNIRSGPGTNYSTVGYLYNGRAVEILEQKTVGSMPWGRISRGWVCMNYIVTEESSVEETPKPEPEPTEETTPEQTPETEPVQTPDPEPETQPEQESEPEQIPVDPVDKAESTSIKGKITADALRIRSGPDTANSIVGHYYQNNTVVITEKVLVGSVYWGKTNKGWINMDYVSTETSNKDSVQSSEYGMMTVIADCLRIRVDTGTDKRIAGFLYYGDTVDVFGTKTVDGTVWGRVEDGWICMDYVK